MLTRSQSRPSSRWFSSPFRPSSLPLAFVVLGVISSPAVAQPEPTPVLLPETVVTASRVPEEASGTMATVEVVTGEEFLEQGYRTLPDALQNTPGVMVQKTTHGHGSPFIRGFTGRQNLLLVDGVRINNSAVRGGPVQYWNTIDPFAMSRIELVKSQGSVQYGSDALGGTLNVLTRGSGFLDEEHGWFWGGAAHYRLDSNSWSNVGRIETRFGQGGRWGAVLGVTLKDFGDIRDRGVGEMKNTGYPEQNYDLKIEGLIAPDTKLTFAHQYLNQDDVWRWHSTVFNDTSWNGTSIGTFPARIYDQERSLTYLKAEGTDLAGAVQNWSATVSFQRSQDSEFQNRGPADLRNQVAEVDTYGLDVQAESALAGGSLIYGLDYYQDEIDSAGSRTGRDPRSQRPLADETTYRLFGAFAQYRRPVTSRFELAAGARFTHADAELGKLWDGATMTDLSAADNWSNVVFNFRSLYQITGIWNVYGGASQGFRAPNVEDLSGNLTSRSGLASIGSLDLEPEKTWTFELGSRVSTDTFDFGAAAFYTIVDDLITSVPITDGSSTVVSTNAQEAWITGLELEAAWRFLDDWMLSGVLTWQDGESDTPAFLGGPELTAPVSRLSPLVASTALRYDSPSERWWAEGRLTIAGEQDDLSPGDQTDTQRIPPGGTPGYVVASLHAGVQATENMELTLGLENITNEDYRIHGSGVNQPGFNAILGARVTW